MTSQQQELRLLISALDQDNPANVKALEQRFIKAVSAGNPVEFLRILIQRALDQSASLQKRDFVNAKDEQQSTALHYASCFGHFAIVRFLLMECEADLSCRDGRGWTALQWAQLNGHENIVTMLKEFDAHDSTVHEVSLSDHDGDYEPRSSASMDTKKNDFYRPGFDFDSMEQELSKVTGHGFGSGWASAMNPAAIKSHSTVGASDEEPEAHPFSSAQFQWDQCLPNEILVFDPRDLEERFNAIQKMPIPPMNRSAVSLKLAYANTIFLMGRYAHYVHGGDLLEKIMQMGVQSISSQIKPGDWSQNAYWLSNASHLLYTLKRDPGLNRATAVFQQHLSEIIEDIYSELTGDAMKHLNGIVGESMSFASIKTTEDIKSNDGNKGAGWGFSSLFKKSTSNDNLKFIQTWMQWTKPDVPVRYSPQTILTYLASLLFVLQSYHCHPSLQKQCLIQLCEHIGRLLGHWLMKQKVTRSLAINLAMNISVIEGWLRSQIPSGSRPGSSMGSAHDNSDEHRNSKTDRDSLLVELSGSVEPYLIYFEPVKQVCQLMQVATTSFASKKAQAAVENIQLNVAENAPEPGADIQASSSMQAAATGTPIDIFLSTLLIISQSTITHYGKHLKLYQFAEHRNLQETAYPLPGVHWRDLKTLLVENYQAEPTESKLHEDIVAFLEVMSTKWSFVKVDENAPTDDTKHAVVPETSNTKKAEKTISLQYPLNAWPHFPFLNDQNTEISFTFHLPVFPTADDTAPQIGLFDQPSSASWENEEIQSQEIRKKFLEQMRQTDMDFWRRTRIEVPSSILSLFKS